MSDIIQKTNIRSSNLSKFERAAQDHKTSTKESYITTVPEELIIEEDNQNSLVQSNNLLHHKLIGGLDGSGDDSVGVLPMVVWGVAHGIYGTFPSRALSLVATGSIIASKVESTAIPDALVRKGLDTALDDLIGKEMAEFGEKAFNALDSNFVVGGKAGTKALLDNVSLLRVGGKMNFIINAAFAGLDVKSVADYYVKQGEEVADHIGEMTGRFVGEATGGAVGFAGGMALGTAAGAAITGAAVGSVVPGVGTAIGLVTGAVIGGVAAVVMGDLGATAGSYVDGNNGEIATL